MHGHFSTRFIKAAKLKFIYKNMWIDFNQHIHTKKACLKGGFYSRFARIIKQDTANPEAS